MSQSDEQSPDEPLGTETFEQGDEALDEESRIDPDFLEDLERDPSLDPTLLVDDLELEEAGALFDDPEVMATLDGGIDDPDGVRTADPGPGRRGGRLGPRRLRPRSAVDRVRPGMLRRGDIFEGVVQFHVGIAEEPAYRRPGRAGALGGVLVRPGHLVGQFLPLLRRPETRGDRRSPGPRRGRAGAPARRRS